MSGRLHLCSLAIEKRTNAALGFLVALRDRRHQGFHQETGLLMESLMATVAQSDKEAKRRIRAFLDRKTAKVKPT